MIPEKDTATLLKEFSGRKILVTGDLVLDHYLEGAVTRISPEAPVPVVSLGDNSERWIPGGAANVALNVLSLGGNPCMAGVVGSDREGEMLLSLLSDAGVDVTAVVTDPGRPTTVKTRIMGRNQQLIRIDREKTDPLDRLIMEKLLDVQNSILDTVCSVILEDYNKGVLFPALIENVIARASGKNIPVAADPKLANFWRFAGCSLFKPNRHEAAVALGTEIQGVEEAFDAADELMKRLPAENVLITLGSMGSILAQQDKGPARHIPTVARHVFDVSGAGDSVIAVMGLVQGSGMDVFDGARLANLAAAAVCAEPGVYAVRPEDIIREAGRFV